MNTTSNLYQELTAFEIQTIINHFTNSTLSIQSQLLSGGMFNTTYLISAQDTASKWVLRVGPINRHLLLYYEHHLMVGEAHVNTLCQQNGIPASEVLLCDTSKTLIDRDYMIVNYIESQALSELTLDQEILDSLYQQTGSYISRLHAITGSHFGRASQTVQNKGFEKWSTYLQFEVQKWREKVESTHLFTTWQLEDITRVFKAYESLLDEITTPCLVHADLWSGNVLVHHNEDDYHVVAIIDGDRAIWGDKDFEFASQWMINDAFITGYGVPLDMSKKAILRRKLYELVYNLSDAYICLIQYNNETNSNHNKNHALELLDELLSQIPSLSQLK